MHWIVIIEMAPDFRPAQKEKENLGKTRGENYTQWFHQPKLSIFCSIFLRGSDKTELVEGDNSDRAKGWITKETIDQSKV